MLRLSLPGRVFLCTLPTDMRKSFDSLAGVVEQQLGPDPLAGDLFVFLSRRGDRLKLLYWDRDGAAVQSRSAPMGLASTPLRVLTPPPEPSAQEFRCSNRRTSRHQITRI